MIRHIKVFYAIVILFIVNFFLLILYNYTQTSKEFEKEEFQGKGEIKKNNKGQILSTEEISNTNEKLVKENIKEKNEKNKENEAKNKDLSYWVNQKNFIENIRQKTEEREREKNNNKIKLMDDKETNNKNNESKQEEKPRFKNAVDDSEEFRSLIPFYKTYQKNILSEEDYDIYSGNWKNVRFGKNAISSLEGIKNRTEYKIKKEALMNDAIQVLKQEPDKQGKGTSYDDERELKFLLKYARDVEMGVRKDELEPEWQWAADISIVYTWVNGSDPIHLEQKSKYNGGIKKVDNRDRSVDELRYSLRSVLKNLPWHKGKIFIVTPGQTPDWLDPSYDRIQIINQEDILPKKDINGNDVNPTFNSFAIEWYLDQIPGVTEQFIQLNDDYFINHPLHPSYFFYGSGESYDIDNSYIKYYNLEYEMKKIFPYYFYKYYRNTKQYKYTSDLTYKEFLKNPSHLKNYYYCLEKVNDKLTEQKSFELTNKEHLSCISKLDAQINNENSINIDDSQMNKNESNIMNNNNINNRNTKNNNININNDKNDNIISNEKLIKQKNRFVEENEDEDENENKSMIKERGEEKNANINEEEDESVKRKSLTKRNLYNIKDKRIVYPNAARHYRFPNLYYALHFLIKDIGYAKVIGNKSYEETTMTERYYASLAMTNGAIKSVFQSYARTNQLEHSPYVWYRDLFPMCRIKFKKFIDSNLTHRFRHPEDVIPTYANQACMRYYASKEGFEKEFDEFYSSKYIYDTVEEAKNGNETRKIVRDRSILKFGFHIVEDKLRETTMRFGQIFDDTNRNLKMYKELIERPNFLFFNLNDDYTEKRVSEELHEFMNYLFP